MSLSHTKDLKKVFSNSFHVANCLDPANEASHTS